MVLAIRPRIDFSGSSIRASTRRVHTTGTPGGKVGRGGIITKLSCFFNKFYGLPLYSITHCYLLLACFSVGFLYILVQKLIF